LSFGKEDIKETLFYWATQDSYSQTMEHGKGEYLYQVAQENRFPSMSCSPEDRNKTNFQNITFSINLNPG
jgi:hypothetical protein